MWRSREIVWLNQSAIGTMQHEAARAFPQETGGVLLGYTSKSAVVIQVAIGPGPRASSTPTSFRPDWQFHEHQIADAYSSSNGITTYLGDWHSHPRGSHRLSLRDIHTMKAIARHKPARVQRPLMLIIAGPPWTPAIWRLGRLLSTFIESPEIRLFVSSV